MTLLNLLAAYNNVANIANKRNIGPYFYIWSTFASPRHRIIFLDYAVARYALYFTRNITNGITTTAINSRL